jgi:hypothetical protein
MQQVRIPLSSGRPFMVGLPVDTTDGELAEAAGVLLTQVLAHVRQYRQRHSSGLVIVGANGQPKAG